MSKPPQQPLNVTPPNPTPSPFSPKAQLPKPRKLSSVPSPKAQHIPKARQPLKLTVPNPSASVLPSPFSPKARLQPSPKHSVQSSQRPLSVTVLPMEILSPMSFKKQASFISPKNNRPTKDVLLEDDFDMDGRLDLEAYEHLNLKCRLDYLKTRLQTVGTEEKLIRPSESLHSNLIELKEALKETTTSRHRPSMYGFQSPENNYPVDLTSPSNKKQTHTRKKAPPVPGLPYLPGSPTKKERARQRSYPTLEPVVVDLPTSPDGEGSPRRRLTPPSFEVNLALTHEIAATLAEQVANQKLMIKGLRHKVAALKSPDETMLPRASFDFPPAAYLLVFRMNVGMSHTHNVGMLTPLQILRSEGDTHLVFFTDGIQALQFALKYSHIEKAALHYGTIAATFDLFLSHYDVSGVNVNLPCRLFDVAGPSEVLVSDDAYHNLVSPTQREKVNPEEIALFRWARVPVRTFANFCTVYMAVLATLKVETRAPPSQMGPHIMFPGIGESVHWEKVMMNGLETPCAAKWPPQGTVALVTLLLADLKSLTREIPAADLSAMMSTFTNIILTTVADHKGYVARCLRKEKWEIVFQTCAQAVQCVMRIQIAMVSAPWPHSVDQHPKTQPVATEHVVLFSGPRTRIGIHYFHAMTEMDPFTLRVGYKKADRSASMCIALACEAGEALVSEECLAGIQEYLADIDFPLARHVTNVTIPEMEKIFSAFSIVPRELGERWKYFTRTVETNSQSNISDEDLRWLAHQIESMKASLLQKSHTYIMTEKIQAQQVSREVPEIIMTNPSLKSINVFDELGISKTEVDKAFLVCFDICHYESVMGIGQEHTTIKSERTFHTVANLVTARHRGMVVRRVGSSKTQMYVCNFQSVVDACNFALTLQYDLTLATWPPTLGEIEGAEDVTGDDDRVVWKGLRTRCAVHTGPAMHSAHPCTGAGEFYGPSVNMVHRLMEVAQEGEILLTPAAMDALQLGGSVMSAAAALAGGELHKFGTTYLAGVPNAVPVFNLACSYLPGRNLIFRKYLTPGYEPPSLDPSAADYEDGTYFVFVRVSDWVTLASHTSDRDIYMSVISRLLKQERGRILEWFGGEVFASFTSSDQAFQFITQINLVLNCSLWSEELLQTENACEVRSDVGVVMRGVRVQVGAHYQACPLPVYDSMADMVTFIGPHTSVPMILALQAHPGEMLLTRTMMTAGMVSANKLFIDLVGHVCLSFGTQPVAYFQVLNFSLRSRQNFFAEFDLVSAHKNEESVPYDITGLSRELLVKRMRAACNFRDERTAAYMIEGSKSRVAFPTSQLVETVFKDNAHSLIAACCAPIRQNIEMMNALREFETIRMFSEDGFYFPGEPKIHLQPNLRNFLYVQGKELNPKSKRLDRNENIFKHLETYTSQVNHLGILQKLLEKFTAVENEAQSSRQSKQKRHDEMQKGWVEAMMGKRLAKTTPQGVVDSEMLRLLASHHPDVVAVTEIIAALKNVA